MEPYKDEELYIVDVSVVYENCFESSTDSMVSPLMESTNSPLTNKPVFTEISPLNKGVS